MTQRYQLKVDVRFSLNWRMDPIILSLICICSKSLSKSIVSDNFQKKGMIWGSKGICTIYEDHKGQIAKVNIMNNNLFPLNINCENLPCFHSVINDKNWLWHSHFGHLNFGSIKLPVTKKMVFRLPFIDSPNEVCETCVLGKKHRVTFPSGKSWRGRKPVELIHLDLC